MPATASSELVVARVVPDLTGLDRHFDYLVPEGMLGQVRVGTCVRVPLAGRRVAGWVVSVGAPDPHIAVERLLPLAKVTGHGPSPAIFELASWAGIRWAGKIRPFLVAASPHTAVTALTQARHGGAVPQPVRTRVRLGCWPAAAVCCVCPRAAMSCRFCSRLVSAVPHLWSCLPWFMLAYSPHSCDVVGARLRCCRQSGQAQPAAWMW